MGVISLQCMTANGSRIVGMSYTHSLKDTDDFQDNYIALVQSNDSPTSIDTMTWSLISAWPRSLYYPQDYSPMVCHVDPYTGVFTMMSAFNLTDPNYVPDPSVPQRPSGGFQYDPQTSIWSDFTISNDYLWEDVTDSFAVFTWPGTSTLVQANVGTTAAVSIGMMTTTAKGAHQFVNALNWTLDPMRHGYPTRLVYGNNVLYQFGTVLANNRTGQLNTILTRIPLSGNLETFQPPANLQTYNSSMQECAPGYLSTSFYEDVLYVFCQGTDGSIGPGTGVVMRFKDGPSFRDKSLGPAHRTDIDRLSGAVIQPIGGSADGKQDPFALVVDAVGKWPIQSISLGDNTLGDSNWSDYLINITSSYGNVYTDPPNHTPAIVGGSVVGGLVILGLILYFVLRKRWPGWRRKIQFKIFEAMMTDDHADGNSSDKNIINKIEEPSSTSPIDLDSQGKILVTEDMEENAVDISTGYMKEVGFEQHPRPTITTTLGATTMGSESGHDGSVHGTTVAEEYSVGTQSNSRTMAYASLSKSSPTTPPYSQDYELTAQQQQQPLLPQQPHSNITTTANTSSSSIWSDSTPPPLAKSQHLPTAPFLHVYTHSDPTTLSSMSAVSPTPFRSTGSPPIPHSISSKEREAWLQVHGSLDSAPPYTQSEQNCLTTTYPPSSSFYLASSSMYRLSPATGVASPIPSHIPLAPPAMSDHHRRHQHLQQHQEQLPQQQPNVPSSSMTPPVPTPRAPQAILHSSVASSSFPSLGLAAGVSRRTRRSF